MNPMCIPPYSIPALGHMNGTASLPSYPRLASSNQQAGHQTFILPPNPRFLPNTLSCPLQSHLQSQTTLPAIFPASSSSITASGVSQMMTTPTRDAFYSIPQTHSSMTVGTDLDSPLDHSSPENLQSDTHNSTDESQLNTFGYSTSPKSISSFENPAMNTNLSPSLNFPNSTSANSMYTPPILPVPTSPTYNSYCLEYTSPLPGGMSPLGSPGHAWSTSALPSSSCPAGHSNYIPRLSYDSPRYKLTPERAIPLIKWFEEHKDHPYPTRQEKMLLCQSTQLTFTQVSTWFANARRRMKKASLEEEELTNGTYSDCSDSSKSSDETAVVLTEISSSITTKHGQDSQQEQTDECHEGEHTNLWNTT